MSIIHPRLKHVLTLFAVSILLVMTIATAAQHSPNEDSTHTLAAETNLSPFKGTRKDFTPLQDKQHASQKMENFLANKKQEPHVERNLSTQKFLTKSELQTTVNEYCSDPNGWVNNPKYIAYGPIKDWDVSLITDMNSLLEDAYNCNPDIGAGWDVSDVTDFVRIVTSISVPSGIPSDVLSSIPTVSPTSISSSSPSGVPSFVPSGSTTPTDCKDSPLRFQFKKKDQVDYNCGWVKEKPQWRCDFKGVSSTCPMTCGKCSKCRDSPLLIKFVKGEKTKTRYCSWVAERPSRCVNIVGTKETCRVVCGVCTP